MDEPKWLELVEIKAIIAEAQERYPHEGIHIISENMLDSALNNPIQAFYYQQESDIQRLAMRYLWSLISAHSLSNSNKRLAYSAAARFLRLNLTVDDYWNAYLTTLSVEQAVDLCLKVATKAISLEALMRLPQAPECSVRESRASVMSYSAA